MKKTVFFLTATVLLSFICYSKVVYNENGAGAPAVDYKHLVDNFKSPDAVYGVDCWWWWLNGNVTKAAITKDLEA
ncbi:MAG: hypothetical protein LBQ01_07560, partial [Prevotellaceae bacterium]|nr:hypothetical protein [Prevotellaceae bacterium]